MRVHSGRRTLHYAPVGRPSPPTKGTQSTGISPCGRSIRMSSSSGVSAPLRAPSASSLAAFATLKREGDKKKRLSSGRPLADAQGITIGVSLNDDESEKARLRAEKARAEEEAHAKKNEVIAPQTANKRKSLGGKMAAAAFGGVPAAAGLPPAAASKPLDIKALNTMFTDCLKLATANKITSKNTWQLDFIRHMGSMLLHKDAPGAAAAAANAGKKAASSGGIFDGGDADDHDNENQFQKASCSLDASMMIYSTRVDDVHKSTFKVLGGLSNGGGGVDEDDEEGAETAPGEEQPKKKKARKAGLATLEANPSKLDTRLLETEVEVDPLFHLTTAKFEGGAGGMLMNNLSVYAGVRLCLDSSEEYVLAPRPTYGTAEQQAAMVAQQEAQLRLNLDLSAFEAQIQERLQQLNTTLDELRLTPTVDYFIDMRAELLAGGDGTGVQLAEQAAADAGKKKGKAAAVAKIVPAAAQIDVDLPALDMMLPPMEDCDASFVGGGGGAFDQDDDENEPFSGLVAQEVAQLDQAIAQEEALNRSMEHAFAQAHGAEDEDGNTVATADTEDGASSVATAQSRKRALEEEDSGYGLLDGMEDMKVNWAGLKHWKFKAKVAPKGTVAIGANGKKKRVAKPKEVLDFASVPFALVAPAKPTESGKRLLLAPYPVASGERRVRQAELSLPEDRFYKLRALQTLCQKPNVMVKLRRPGVAAQGKRSSDGMRVVDSESKNGMMEDSQPPRTPMREAALQIVPVSTRLSPFAGAGDISLSGGAEDAAVNMLQFDGGADSDDENEPGGGDFGFGGDADHEDADEDANPFGGPSDLLSLIAAPTRAEKISVSYDRVSKTVDVKALKAAMWSGVADTVRPVDVAVTTGSGKNASTKTVSLNQTTFQSAIDAVPEHFPQRVAHQLPSVSVSYCFISMLHLCNEHGLTLLAPGANADAESANRIPDVAAAAKLHPQEFVRDTDHVKIIGERNPQAYYVGDFLVRKNL